MIHCTPISNEHGRETKVNNHYCRDRQKGIYQEL